MRRSQGRCEGVRSRRDQMSRRSTRPRRCREVRVVRSQFRSGRRRKPSLSVSVAASVEGAVVDEAVIVVVEAVLWAR